MRSRIVIGLSIAVVAISALVWGCSSARATEVPVCVSGTLFYRSVNVDSGPDEEVTRARGIDWDLVDSSSGGRSEVVASGATDHTSGLFKACSRHEGNYALRFKSASGTNATVVLNKGTGKAFEFVAGTFDKTADLGSVAIDSLSESYAWKIADVARELFGKRRPAPTECWFAQPKVCGTMTIVWSSNPRDDDSEFDIDNDRVIIGHNDAKSAHLVLHEAAHWLHYNEATDGGWPTVDNCDEHTAEKSSSLTCAWTEGFADAAAAYALGDTRYVHSDGTDVEFGPHANTSSWDDGPTVQGRVAGALLQIWSEVDSGDWSSTLSILSRNVHSIEDYYEERAWREPEKKAAIRAILEEHTIAVR